MLLVPGYTQVVPRHRHATRLTRTIPLNIPIISAAMDTVTEAPMAIAMAQQGGLGVIHKNLDLPNRPPRSAGSRSSKSGMVVNPVTIQPDQTLADVQR